MSTHTLYRFFDRTGGLLYVGRTTAPSKRWAAHERKAPWFPDVASMTREVYPDAEAVDLAERTAIATEGPLHNIALNPNWRPAPKPVEQVVPDGYPDSLIKRWASLYPDSPEIEPVLDCLGDPIDCDCPACHEHRLNEFEDCRSKYEWHPDLMEELVAVEAKYYRGAYLPDWYYDFFDIEMFARMRLVGESQTIPLPAYVEFTDTVATVECPLCFATHRHFLASGAVLSSPIAAGCERMTGGQYVLYDDWYEMTNALWIWGKRSAKRTAA